MDACQQFAKERNEFLDGIETALIYQDVSDEAGGAL